MELHELLLQRAHARLQELNSEAVTDALPAASMTPEAMQAVAQLAHAAGAYATAIAQTLDERAIDPCLAAALHMALTALLERLEDGIADDMDRLIAEADFLRIRSFLEIFRKVDLLEELWREAAVIRATGAPSNAVDA